jgi:hypothetical protein
VRNIALVRNDTGDIRRTTTCVVEPHDLRVWLRAEKSRSPNPRVTPRFEIPPLEEAGHIPGSPTESWCRCLRRKNTADQAATRCAIKNKPAFRSRPKLDSVSASRTGSGLENIAYQNGYLSYRGAFNPFVREIEYDVTLAFFVSGAIENCLPYSCFFW